MATISIIMIIISKREKKTVKKTMKVRRIIAKN